MHCTKFLFQISNVFRKNSFGGCCNLVLSWSHGRKNKRTFHHFHYLQDHFPKLFQDLDYWTLACAILANSNTCIFTIFILSEILNVIPNALLRTIQSQSGFNNANILQIMFANVTSIGPPEKCKVAIHAIQTDYLDPINVGSIVG